MRQRISYVELLVNFRTRWDHFSAQAVLDTALELAGLRKQALYDASEVRRLAAALRDDRSRDRKDAVVTLIEQEARRLEEGDVGDLYGASPP